MTIKSIETRTYALEHLWEKYHNKKILQQLTSDIVFFSRCTVNKRIRRTYR